MFRSVLLSCLAVAVLAPAHLLANDADERFTFTVVGAPKTALGDERLHLSIHGWSNDDDRDAVAAALAADDQHHSLRAPIAAA